MCKTALLGPLSVGEGYFPCSVVLACWARLFKNRKQRLEISPGVARAGPKEREACCNTLLLIDSAPCPFSDSC